MNTLESLIDLVWPASCACCGAWGVDLCPSCDEQWRSPESLVVTPHHLGGRRVHAAHRFEGAVRTGVTAYKDTGRTCLRPSLVRSLRWAVADALTSAEAASVDQWMLIPVPSSSASRRRRGRAPLDEVAEGVLSGAHKVLRRGPVLRHRHHVRDQSGLGREARWANVSGAFEASRGSPSLEGMGVVIVDDVVTTGATLAAAAAAIGVLEPTVVHFAVVAARDNDCGQGRDDA